MRTLALLLLTACAATTPAPITSSTWTVTRDGSPAGTATLTTSAAEARVEYRTDPDSPPAVFVQRGGTTWLLTSHGEVDFATISAMTPAYTVAPALLNADWSSPYRYRGVTATYRGKDLIEIATPGGTFVVTRNTPAAAP